MLTRDFDYELPPESIAQFPAPRGESRLLVLDRESPERHARVKDLPRLLSPGDLLVVNDTRVIPARIFGRRLGAAGGEEAARVEVLLVERTAEREWVALTRPGRRTRPGTRIDFGEGLLAEVVAKEGDGRHRVRFSAEVEPHLDRIGHVPLPPYIKRADEAADRERYQTVYARRPGAIAAPTAGLHLSEELLAELGRAGVETAAVTLHVGIGTFKPVTAELVHEHRMDAERYEIPAETAAAVGRTRRRGGRVVAVGTTVVRALESAAIAGSAGSAGVAGVAGVDGGAGESGSAGRDGDAGATGTAGIAGSAEVDRAGQEQDIALVREDTLQVGAGRTELFITPGFHFRVVDALLTNFHLPRSTLLMLVAAFAGRERVLAAYREAVAAGYRFYSYGDAMLVERAGLAEPSGRAAT